MPFHKLAENKVASIQNWKSGQTISYYGSEPSGLREQEPSARFSSTSMLECPSRITISFIFEETDIASFPNAFAKSAETEMHHYLSLFTLEFDAGAK